MTTRDRDNERDRSTMDAFDILEGGETTRQQLRDVIMPQVERRAAAASTIDQTDLQLFRKKARGCGRRCSCFEISASPNRDCRVCFGVGVAGGYEKLGFREETIDVSRLNLRMVNVQPRYDRIADAPRRFGLLGTATFGVIEGEVDLVDNVGTLDAFSADYTALPDAGAVVKIRGDDDGDWVPLTMQDRTALLEPRLAGQRLAFRIELWRSGLTAPVAEFEHLYLRYQVNPTGPVRRDPAGNLIPGTFFHADINRTPSSLSRGQVGLYRAFEERATTISGALAALSTEDFFSEIGTTDRWKVQKVNEGRSQGHTWEWTFITRIVQPYREPYGRVP